MAAALLDPEFATAFRDGLIERWRAVMRSLLARARTPGELAPGCHDLLLDLAYGAMWYRLLHARPRPPRARRGERGGGRRVRGWCHPHRRGTHSWDSR
jgi:hypothetical protein